MNDEAAPGPRLTHLDAAGRVVMVDVGDKPETARSATAACVVVMAPATWRLIAGGTAPKGDVLTTARLAGIMAAKRTSELIPLCHPLPIGSVSVDIEPIESGPVASGPGEGGNGGVACVAIRATVTTTGRTGVEMEALTAASIAALTIYDMCKAVDRAMRVEHLRVVEKAGGRSGAFSQA